MQSNIDFSAKGEYIDVQRKLRAKKGNIDLKESLLEEFNKLVLSGKLQKSTIEEKRKQMEEFLFDFDGKKEKLEKKYESLKDDILFETGVELSKEKDVIETQERIYLHYNIDRYTYKNDSMKQFSKGLIDSIFIGNFELVELVKREGFAVVKQIIDYITSEDGLKEILTHLGMSIVDLITGNSYEKGRSIGDLGLIGTGAGIGFNLAKSGLKKMSLNSIKKNLDNTSILPYKVKNGNLIIENISYIKNLDESILRKQILETINNARNGGNDIKSIDFSGNYTTELKEKINHIVGLNYPLLNISRLMPGQNVPDITFLGVKDLNDNVSKEFVDLFVAKFKEEIKENFKKADPTHGRIVRSDFKHITQSLPPEKNIAKSLFSDCTNREEFIKKVFSKIDNTDLDKVMSLSNKKITRDEIEKKLLDNFDFGLGISKVSGKKGDNISNESKLETFYESEISARINSGDKKIDVNNFSFENIIESTKKAFKFENDIKNQYTGKEFEMNGTKYPVLKENISGEVVIDDRLLRFVRKGKDIGDENLNELVKGYLKNLNNGFDFISPFVNKKQFNEINSINNGVSSGKIDISYIEKNYKGTYTKEALETMSNGKEGLRVFVDIVDMGIMNLDDFRSLAKKVLSGEINKDNKKELLDAGGTVTRKFQALVKEVEKIPGAKVALAGDELYVFVEGKVLNTNKILDKISNNLSKTGLRGRISHSNDKDNKGVFDSLDSTTIINKEFETKIEEIIVDRGLKKKMPDNINLDIDYKVLEGDGKIDKFLEGLKNNIDTLKLEKLVKTTEKGVSEQVAEINGMRVVLEKLENGNYNLKVM